MQQKYMAERAVLEFDGENVPGLVRIGEMTRANEILTVPELGKVKKIRNGQIDIPAMECTYALQRNANTLTFFKDWWENGGTKDVVKIFKDADGAEFRRQSLPACELVSFTDPEVNHESPTYSQLRVVILPDDIIDLESEV